MRRSASYSARHFVFICHSVRSLVGNPGVSGFSFPVLWSFILPVSVVLFLNLNNIIQWFYMNVNTFWHQFPKLVGTQKARADGPLLHTCYLSTSYHHHTSTHLDESRKPGSATGERPDQIRQAAPYLLRYISATGRASPRAFSARLISSCHRRSRSRLNSPRMAFICATRFVTHDVSTATEFGTFLSA
jgi:hypothetical protein